MPPKRLSTSKKEQVQWFLCEKCESLITAPAVEGHENVCPFDENSTEHSFIRHHKLYTTTIEPKKRSEELESLTDDQYNNIIYISETVMRICKFKLGQPVLINADQEGFPMVRLAWPINNNHCTTVYISDDEYTRWNLKSSQIRISNLHRKTFAADTIEFSCKNNEEKLNWRDETFQRIVFSQLEEKLITEGNNFLINFFNKSLELRVEKVTKKSDITDLTSCFDDLNIGDAKNFYSVTKLTYFKILEEKIAKEPDNVNNSIEIGGLDGIINDLTDRIQLALGIKSLTAAYRTPRTILLYGPPGCGKTLICNKFMNEFGNAASIIQVNTVDIFGKYFGETESNLTRYFNRVFENHSHPSLMIIEDVGTICGASATSDALKRLSTVFMAQLDLLHTKLEGNKTVVLCTTNNIDNLDTNLRRNGRIDIEIEIPVPSPDGRFDILYRNLKFYPNSLTEDDVRAVSKKTHAYVGSDLMQVLTKAGMKTIERSKNSSCPQITISDIEYALSKVKPSAMREVLIECPDVRWNNIGGQHDLKLKLKQAIEWPLEHPETFKRLGIHPPKGLLMFGPPGCSKTMVAKALATESNLNFLSIKGSELFSMWVGESERAVRDLFRKARQVAPSIIFFDEIDAISAERTSDGNSSVKERVLAQLLTEMDGVNVLRNVTVIAATNRPDMIDKALLRPGRFDRIVYVRLPDEETRKEIFEIKLKRMPVGKSVSIDELVNLSVGYSGAEIESVCQEAALKTLEENLEATSVERDHFLMALKFVKPRTSPELLKLYEDYLSSK